VDEYPTTVTGKVQKFKLRELGVQRFGLQQAATVETA
jgi:fatty-acyl-CoA synthase